MANKVKRLNKIKQLQQQPFREQCDAYVADRAALSQSRGKNWTEDDHRGAVIQFLADNPKATACAYLQSCEPEAMELAKQRKERSGWYRTGQRDAFVQVAEILQRMATEILESIPTQMVGGNEAPQRAGRNGHSCNKERGVRGGPSVLGGSS